MLLAAVPTRSDTSTLRLVSDHWPPFTDEEGRARVAIEIVQAALTRTGQAFSITIGTENFGEIVESIRAGEFEGSAALWKTPERERFLEFSKPFLENRLVLVGRKGSPVEIRSMSELAGKRVATVSAYAYGEVLATTTGPEFVAGKSDEANLRKLLDGDVDYVLADELLIHHVFKHQTVEAEQALEVGRTPLVSRKLHFAVRKDLKNSGEIVKRFDGEIRAMMADGSFHRALDVDWIWADIDGDGASELVLRGAQAGVAEPRGGYDVITKDGYASETVPSPYVIEGVRYEDWEGVPDRYKVEIDRTRAPIEPTITLFRF
jgi:ABC-type amino acid transport substrate-binding protein